MSPPLIRVEGLTKEYALGAETVRALRGIDLVVDRNEYLAVMGPSGSGKSTFMNVIGCLDSPTSGHYWLNGEPVEGLDEDALARIRNREIGFVFQSFHLLPRSTALENVQLPLVYSGVSKAERRERAAEMLKKVGLGDRLGHRPERALGRTEAAGGDRPRAGDPAVAAARGRAHRRAR